MILRNVSNRVVILKDASHKEYRIPSYGELEVSSDVWADQVFRNWLRYRERSVVVIDSVDSLLPWVIDINPIGLASYSNNWNTNSVSSLRFMNGARISSGDPNAEVAWDVTLAAGIWSFQLCHHTGTDVGIYSVLLDGINKGTIDGYANPGADNVFSSIENITISMSKKYRLSLKMENRNPLNVTAFKGAISLIRLVRTQ